MEKIKKHCKQCKKLINPNKGRSDRVFCSDKCKNKFHNARNEVENAELKRIELILRKNHRILMKMFLRKDKDEISRERLLKEGFNFDFHTHHIISKIKGYEYIFSHGYGYREVAGGQKYKVVKAFEYREE